ncbi:MAG: UDP-3-O-[3-hydroxymyristoyl] N-acetylglucosamine deacetylase [Pseudomonadota bacterium]|jgi:UDP-3-O-acyl N-acetylglucosamine deacetylase
MHTLANQHSYQDSTSSNQLVLVVDDEASIRRSLEGVLKDEGFSVVLAEDGESAIRILMNTRPALVLLDIWMPGMDGLETLRKIKEIHQDLPVVMISGHATISTAVAATRLGAMDFLEKPLDLSGTIQLVRRVLHQADAPVADTEPRWEAIDPASVGPLRESVTINPVVFTKQTLRGRAMPQKTLAHAAILYGQGLHSGRKSGLILEPLPPNSGIHFVGVSETTVVPAHVDFVESTGFATTVRLGQTQAGTIEHLMSALCAYGISNVLIKCNGEVPVMDGSAREFCRLFEEVGLSEQDGEWYEIDIRKVIEVGDGKESIRIEPADEFSVDYTLRYPEPVGEQQFSFTLTDSASYRDQIAAARTFSFVKDVGHLQRQGLALGGRFDNFLLIGTEGAINDEWRYPNEPVRHKVLDAIGDLFLLGRRLRGKVTARMTGHSDNIAILKKVRDELMRAAS